jgi:FlaA1/EpsC-like NDP-sugar epimerase
MRSSTTRQLNRLLAASAPRRLERTPGRLRMPRYQPTTSARRTMATGAKVSATDIRSSRSYTDNSIQERMSLKEKVVVITGGARGIGLALAYAVAQSGANVAVLDSLKEPHEDFWQLEKKFGIKAKMYQ